MKKYINTLLSFSLLLILSACGSTSGTTTKSSSDVAVSPYLQQKILQDEEGTQFTLTLSLRKELEKSYAITLDQFSLVPEGDCRIKSVNFEPTIVQLDGDMGSLARVDFSGEFESNCTLEGYHVTARQVVTQESKEKVESFTLDYDYANPNASATQESEVTADGYRFYNATTPLSVTQVKSPYEIKVQLIKDNYISSGQTVKMRAFPSECGDVDSYSAITGEDGYARFSYHSPATLPDMCPEVIQLDYTTEKNVTITQNIALAFDPQVITTVDKIYVSPSYFTITEPGEVKKVTIVTVNRENVGISANIQIEQPNNGSDYGRFESNYITTNESGYAVVNYIAPDSISGLVDRSITFTEVSQNLSEELLMKFNTSSGPGIDYEITLFAEDSLSVDSTAQVTVRINEVGKEDAIIADENVFDVNVTSIFTNILTFNDDAQATEYDGMGIKPLAVNTKTLSGTALLDINATIFNGDSNVTISRQVSLVVLSGKVTAMSLVYARTLPEDDTGIHQNVYTIHAVDKYNNPARAGIVLHPSVINGTTVIRTRANADDGAINQANPDTFSDDNAPFTDVDVERDILSILPNASRQDPAYLGNWSLEDKNSDSELVLSEDYLASSIDGLNYIIGNADRYIDGYGVATVDIKSNTGSYITDENGNVEFIVSFDRILSGHTVTLSANAYDTERTGVAKIAPLRWDNYISSEKEIQNDGEEHNVTLTLGIDGGVEHLVGVDIVPSSIMSNDSGCDVNTSADNDLRTDANGQIRVQMSTGLGDSKAVSCKIYWRATSGDIYIEY
jgi:hypothetical protein